MKFKGEEMSNFLQAGIHHCEIFIEKDVYDYTNSKGDSGRACTIGFRDAGGRVVFEDYYLSPRALWRLEELFVFAGVKKEDVDLPDLVGCFVIVTVSKETYVKGNKQREKSVVVRVEPEPKDGETVTYHEESGDKVVEGSKSDPF